MQPCIETLFFKKNLVVYVDDIFFESEVFTFVCVQVCLVRKSLKLFAK